MWWWLLALAPGAPERIIVGNERAYLAWFYNRVPGMADAVADGVDEYLRTFTGAEGVLGALGVYRGAPETARQTEELAGHPVTVPVIGVGGNRSRGGAVARWLGEVCEQVEEVVIDGGRFLPEESAPEIAALILRAATSAVGSTRPLG